MKKIVIINGPNLNLLGKRETDIYGNQSFETFFISLKQKWPKIELTYFQSNSEGSLVDQFHEVGFDCDGIVYNGGAYTHTSIAIRDAIAAITVPVIEVHISNIHARESFRVHSYSAAVCIGIVSGLGLNGYHLAIQHLTETF